MQCFVFDKYDSGLQSYIWSKGNLGIIRTGDQVFHIYEVKGDKERNYLYWIWEWEGEMYIRKELLDIEK